MTYLQNSCFCTYFWAMRLIVSTWKSLRDQEFRIICSAPGALISLSSPLARIKSSSPSGPKKGFVTDRQTDSDSQMTVSQTGWPITHHSITHHSSLITHLLSVTLSVGSWKYFVTLGQVLFISSKCKLPSNMCSPTCIPFLFVIEGSKTLRQSFKVTET